MKIRFYLFKFSVSFIYIYKIYFMILPLLVIQIYGNIVEKVATGEESDEDIVQLVNK